MRQYSEVVVNRLVDAAMKLRAITMPLTYTDEPLRSAWWLFDKAVADALNTVPGVADCESRKHQPCGCVLCTCEDEDQCQGCGAKFCSQHGPGNHPFTRIDVAPAPAMPECVRRVVDVLQSVALAKFPELCGTPSETKINDAIKAVKAHYGEKP